MGESGSFTSTRKSLAASTKWDTVAALLGEHSLSFRPGSQGNWGTANTDWRGPLTAPRWLSKTVTPTPCCPPGFRIQIKAMYGKWHQNFELAELPSDTSLMAITEILCNCVIVHKRPAGPALSRAPSLVSGFFMVCLLFAYKISE